MRPPPGLLVRAGRVALVATATLASACEKSPFDPDRLPSQEPPAPRAGAPKELAALDAGVAVERADPVTPAGDLREEVARFTTLDACVAEHALSDPLVGDALRSIGYDTLLRDACRILQALKLKDAGPCSLISASGLQRRCEATVAIAIKDPSRCPWTVASQKRLGRDVSCLAVSTHDARICAAELESARATCEALASGDASACGRATGEGRSTCARDVERLAPLVQGEHLAHPTTPPSAHLTIHGAKGTADLQVADVDLSSGVAGGAVIASEPAVGVVMTFARDAEGSLGLPTRLERTHITASVALGDGVPRLSKLDIIAPKVPELACPSPHCSLTVSMPKAEGERGSPLAAVVEGTIETPQGTYQVKLQIDSFVRDLVGRTELFGAR
jgi:hypothetical protein